MRMLTVMMMMMMMILHAFLWGSVLSVQNGCLLYVAERTRGALVDHQHQQ